MTSDEQYATGWQFHVDSRAGAGLQPDFENLTNVRIYGPAHAVPAGTTGEQRAKCGRSVFAQPETPWPAEGINPDGDCPTCKQRTAA